MWESRWPTQCFFPQLFAAYVLALVGFTAIPSVHADPDPQAVADQVALVEQFTAELLQGQAAGMPAGDPGGARDLFDIASDRKTAMLTLRDLSPAEFMRLAMSPETQASLPPTVQTLIEDYVWKLGTLEVTIEEDPAGSEASVRYVLKDGSVSYQLQFVQEPPGALSGAITEAAGVMLDGTLTLLAGQATAGFYILEEVPTQSLGEQKLLVILANFQDYPQDRKSVV